MTKLFSLLPAAALLIGASPVAAYADRVPQQFVGSWCAEQTPRADAGNEVIYNRDRICKSAHEPEDIITIKTDRLLISDIAVCKFLETASVTRHGTHLLKFWCKNTQYDESWIYEVFLSIAGRNKIAVENKQGD